MSALVHKYFEAAIKSELGPNDAFCSRGELEYLVTFHNTPLAEARLMCVAIAQFACERLFGKDGEDLVVRTLMRRSTPPILTRRRSKAWWTACSKSGARKVCVPGTARSLRRRPEG